MNDKKTFRKIFSEFFPFLKKFIQPYFIYFFYSMLGTVLFEIFYLINPFLYKTLFDDAFIGKDFRTLLIVLILILSINVILAILNSIWDYFYRFLCSIINFNIENNIYYHVLKLPLNFFNKYRTGETMKRIWDSSVIHESMNLLIFNFIKNIFVILINLAACIYLSPVLTLIILAFLPVYVLNNKLQGKLARKQEIERWDIDKVASSEFSESIIGIRTVKAFSIESKILRKYKYLKLQMRKLQFKYLRKFTLLNWFISAYDSGKNFITLLIAGIFLINGNLTLGEWIAFSSVSGRLYGPLLELMGIYTKFQTNSVIINRLSEVSSFPEEKYHSTMKTKIHNGNIVLKNVFFSYKNDENYVLKDINLEIKSGQTIALVGLSGAGKTTLVNLVAKYYEPSKGELFIDNINLKEYDVKFLRNKIGMVLQDTYMFCGSVIENLRLAAHYKSEEEIIKACKKARAHDFIMQMPEGYHTVVGEKGITLSGGQRQRIAIAQAILKNPKILILDEATSHLDLETEALIQEAMKEIMKNTTSIVIAHRLSTIQNADCICVIHNGYIIEKGTHKELMSKETFYNKLYSRIATI